MPGIYGEPTWGAYEVALVRRGDPHPTIQESTAFQLAWNLVQHYTGRTFTRTDDDVTELAGTRERRLVLGDAPVHAVSAVVLDGTALAPAEYRVQRRGVLWRSEGWCDASSTVQLTWSHGHDYPPHAVRQAAVTCAARLATNPDALSRLAVEGYEQTFGSGSFGFTIGERVVLDRYRRRVWP